MCTNCESGCKRKHSICRCVSTLYDVPTAISLTEIAGSIGSINLYPKFTRKLRGEMRVL